MGRLPCWVELRMSWRHSRSATLPQTESPGNRRRSDLWFDRAIEKGRSVVGVVADVRERCPRLKLAVVERG
jgi:hypothetical protein